MKPKDQSAICGKCGTRPAKNFISYAGTEGSVELCDECLGADESFPTTLVARFADEAKDARCCYCGGFPCGGGPDTLSQITGAKTQNCWMCMPCSIEYFSFTQNALAANFEGRSLAEQIDQITKVGAEADDHMAEFVRRRDS